LKIENKAKQQLDQELICRHIVRMLAIPWKKKTSNLENKNFFNYWRKTNESRMTQWYHKNC